VRAFVNLLVINLIASPLLFALDTIKDGIYYPRTKSELQSLILHAMASKSPVRVAGAAHSARAAIFGAKNTGEMRINLSGDFRKIISITPDTSHDFAIVKVGAGCNLGVNPADHRSTLDNSFNYQVNEAGFALPMLGGISHQTIAGFLQTSSSGGSVQHGIADVLEAIEWIDGNGVFHQANKGDDEFNAVAVSMGLFGIITQVTFKLQKKYLVEGQETNHQLNDSYLAKDTHGSHTQLHDALFVDHEYIHINWLPQKYVDRTMQWIGKSIAFDNTLPIVSYEHALKSKVKTTLATVVFGVGNFIDRLASCCDVCLRLKAQLYKPFANPNNKQEFRDIWYRALPVDDQADVDGVVKTHFSELWFPEDRMDLVMQKLEQLFAENPTAAGNFIVELYAAKQSPLWLSPAFGHNAFRVDLYWWDKNHGDINQYFSLFWEKLLDIPGARLHWGKYLPIPGQQYGDKVFESDVIYRNYPLFNKWLTLREVMDPQQLFVTDYWRSILNIPPLS
jgi:hypothetical protein